MAVVYLSVADACYGDHCPHAIPWLESLRRSGHEVILHPPGGSTSYDQIMVDIKRCDAMVALVAELSSTLGGVEKTSAAEGRDTFNSTRGTWEPKLVLAWRDHPPLRWDPFGNTYLSRMISRGQAIRLPDEFKKATRRANKLLEALPTSSPPEVVDPAAGPALETRPSSLSLPRPGSELDATLAKGFAESMRYRRAMDRRSEGPNPNLILLTAFVGFFLIGFGLFYFSTGGPGNGANPTLSINDAALIAGVVLELLAVTLFARRLWVRSRS